jgi:hypothetical protein
MIPLQYAGAAPVAMDSVPDYRSEVFSETYEVFNPETGQWELRTRKRIGIVPYGTEVQDFRGDEITGDNSVDVADVKLVTISGVNVERLRIALVEIAESRLGMRVADHGSVVDNTASVILHETIGNALFEHRVSAGVNQANSRITLRVRTRGFTRVGSSLVSVPRLQDRDRAERLADRIGDGLRAKPDS